MNHELLGEITNKLLQFYNKLLRRKYYLSVHVWKKKNWYSICRLTILLVNESCIKGEWVNAKIISRFWAREQLTRTSLAWDTYPPFIFAKNK